MIITGCGSDEDKSTGSKPDRRRKTYICISGLYKPFNYEEGGELTGFDVEIGAAIAEKMGLEPNPVTNSVGNHHSIS